MSLAKPARSASVGQSCGERDRCARTPEAVIARLNRDIAAAAAHPEVRRRMEEVGAEPVGSSPAELRDAVSQQVAQVRPLVAELRLQVE